MTVKLFFVWSARDGLADVILENVVEIDKFETGLIRFIQNPRPVPCHEYLCPDILRCEVE